MPERDMKPLAEGRTAEIYPWEQGFVLKLFRDWVPRDHVNYEAELARAVAASGLPVPAVGEVVEVDGRAGLIYERVDGPTLLEAFRKRPWTLRSTAALLARLHAELHATSAAAVVPGQRARLVAKIEGASLLSPALRDAALGRLATLPDGDAVCHGDFHPGNVIMASSGPVVIDWIDATRGHPHADVARTIVLVRFGIPRGGPLAQRVLRLAARRLLTLYKHEYGRRTGTRAADIEPWLPVVAAARLDEGVGESPQLAAYVERSFERTR